ncbi:MAG: inositol monophosphatase [Gammaproteobacteria bacterium]|nr:MAG: inositol monophosphatase [Gammaproteobacteria bacterium]
MHPLLTIAKRAAYAAGDIVVKSFEQASRLDIKEKGPNDFVSNVDLASEAVLIETIRESYPDHLIIAEESGQTGKADSEYRWVLDPIDGTTNFIKGLPHFAISIGIYKNNKLEAGLVYQPVTDEMFCAARGQGATLNDRKIRASAVLPENAVIATGIPFRKPELHSNTIANLKNVLVTFPDIRRGGAASLDLCYVACGRVDGYYECGLSEWDIAAGALIAQESGAIVSDVNGNLTHLQTGNIVAAPPKVYKALVKVLKS